MDTLTDTGPMNPVSVWEASWRRFAAKSGAERSALVHAWVMPFAVPARHMTAALAAAGDEFIERGFPELAEALYRRAAAMGGHDAVRALVNLPHIYHDPAGRVTWKRAPAPGALSLASVAVGASGPVAQAAEPGPENTSGKHRQTSFDLRLVR